MEASSIEQTTIEGRAAIEAVIDAMSDTDREAVTACAEEIKRLLKASGFRIGTVALTSVCMELMPDALSRLTNALEDDGNIEEWLE